MSDARGYKLFEAHGTARASALEGTVLASFRSRAAAFLLDMAVVLVLVILWGLPGAIREVRLGHTQTLAVPFEPFNSLEGLLFTVLYFGAATWVGRGRTLGKRALGIRVVSLTHERITLWQSVERALGYGASALEMGFGFFQYFIHPNRQTVHDRIAETVVVKERGVKPLATAAPPPPAEPPSPPAASP